MTPFFHLSHIGPPILLLIILPSLVKCHTLEDIVYYNVIKEVKRLPPTLLHVHSRRMNVQRRPVTDFKQGSNIPGINLRPSGYRVDSFQWRDDTPIPSARLQGSNNNFDRPPAPLPDIANSYHQPALNNLPVDAVQFSSFFNFDSESDSIPENPFTKKRRNKKVHPQNNFGGKRQSESQKKNRSRASINRNSGDKHSIAFCPDKHEKCGEWATEGQCEDNAFWMKPNCQTSCDSCGLTVETVALQKVKLVPGCTNNRRLCGFWASDGECTRNRLFMSSECQLSCNFCDSIINRT